MTQPRLPSSSLEPFEFPGRYVDAIGSEEITWRVLPSSGRSTPGMSGFELHTAIRGVPFWGYDFDGLMADNAELAASAGLPQDLCERGAGGSVISGELPYTMEKNGARFSAALGFTLRLGPQEPGASPMHLTLMTEVAGATYTVTDEWFEGGLQRLETALPEGVRLVCCFTCLYSDYSPSGHGLVGMSCHRGAKEQYLGVRSKSDYWAVPATEDVMETHLCAEYQRRKTGTGYRGWR